MGTKHQNWFRWETDVQEALDLQPMPGSGNQWYAPSDGKTVGHWTETRWPVMVDCKHTVLKSYSLARKALDQWVTTAQANGCHFALPIRFETADDTPTTRSDYVVIPFSDYAELVALHREGIQPESLTREEARLLSAVADAVKDKGIRSTIHSIVHRLYVSKR